MNKISSVNAELDNIKNTYKPDKVSLSYDDHFMA